MSTIVGTRPSGRLHIGHYASVIKPAKKHGARVLIAEYHAPGQPITGLIEQLMSLGIRRDQIVRQSKAFNGRLFFELLESTPSGLLNHMPQYKVKDKNALMLTYPVLMAHDIAGFDYVVVGDDQKPHIEFANDILPKLGLKCPEPIYEGGRIMDLRHPENKMSKSEPNSCLFLDDEDYERKIKKAVTTEAGRANLENIYYLLAEPGLSTSQALIRGLSNIELKMLIIDLYKQIFIEELNPQAKSLETD